MTNNTATATETTTTVTLSIDADTRALPDQESRAAGQDEAGAQYLGRRCYPYTAAVLTRWVDLVSAAAEQCWPGCTVRVTTDQWQCSGATAGHRVQPTSGDHEAWQAWDDYAEADRLGDIAREAWEQVYDLVPDALGLSVPFCACGRRLTECDGSRAGCTGQTGMPGRRALPLP
jgi:hypothetical protein